MTAGPQAVDGELRLAPESVEEIAGRLAELLRGTTEPQPPQRLISAAKVAESWGVERSWVYAHADQLGARRLGTGKRPRLRFDPEEVAERIAALTGSEDARGSSGMRGDSGRNWLSRPHQDTLAGQLKTAGRRSTRPRPGAERGVSTHD
jgi:hypothetical protein